MEVVNVLLEGCGCWITCRSNIFAGSISAGGLEVIVMIAKEKVGHSMHMGITNKRIEELIKYRKEVKECSLCEEEVEVGKDNWGEFGYIHHRYKKDCDNYEYYFLVLCNNCFTTIKKTVEKLRIT